MNKLNYGCGSIQPDDWTNIDIDPQYKTYSSLVDFKDNYFDMVVSHAVICAVPINDIESLLKDIFKKMRKGGVIRISLPDIEAGFEAYKKQDINWFPNKSELAIDIIFSHWLTWYSTSVSLLTPVALGTKLLRAGFMTLQLASYKKTNLSTTQITELDTREGEFYFMEAMK